MKNNLINRAKRLFTPALIFHTDIVVKKAEGLYVESTDGKRYMDFSSGLATTNIGHCHPSVVKAAKKQIDELIHSGCIFYYNSEIELAERLKEITPGKLDMFFFSNSGAEAGDNSIYRRFSWPHNGRCFSDNIYCEIPPQLSSTPTLHIQGAISILLQVLPWTTS